jgi:hypothetical protein
MFGNNEPPDLSNGQFESFVIGETRYYKDKSGGLNKTVPGTINSNLLFEGTTTKIGDGNCPQSPTAVPGGEDYQP